MKGFSMKVLVRDDYIRHSDAKPAVGDCEVELSQEFLDVYYEALDEWNLVQTRLIQICEKRGIFIDESNLASTLG